MYNIKSKCLWVVLVVSFVSFYTSNGQLEGESSLTIPPKPSIGNESAQLEPHSPQTNASERSSLWDKILAIFGESSSNTTVVDSSTTVRVASVKENTANSVPPLKEGIPETNQPPSPIEKDPNVKLKEAPKESEEGNDKDHNQTILNQQKVRDNFFKDLEKEKSFESSPPPLSKEKESSQSSEKDKDTLKNKKKQKSPNPPTSETSGIEPTEPELPEGITTDGSNKTKSRRSRTEHPVNGVKFVPPFVGDSGIISSYPCFQLLMTSFLGLFLLKSVLIV